MNHSFLILAIGCLFAGQAGAILLNDGDDHKIVTGDIDWNILDFIDDDGSAKTLYWTKIVGNYNVNLGEASLLATQNEGGELAVFTTNTDWSTNLGIGVTSNTNPYMVRTSWAGDPHMSLFIAHPQTNSQQKVEFRINTYNYKMDGTDHTYQHAVSKEDVTTTMAQSVYDERVYGNLPTNTWDNPNTGQKLTFGFTLTSAHDVDGAITGLRLTMPDEFLTPDYTMSGTAMGESVAADTPGATRVNLELDATISKNGNNYLDLPNMGAPFDLTNLISYGTASVNGVNVYGIDDDAVTYILIKKDLRADNTLIPEPTTTTLSLLALAGLAARRRRK